MKIELRYDPANALLGIYSKDTNVVIQMGICTPMFIAAMSTIAKLWKEPRCPSTDEWIKKMWYIYTMEYYAATVAILNGSQHRVQCYPLFLITRRLRPDCQEHPGLEAHGSGMQESVFSCACMVKETKLSLNRKTHKIGLSFDWLTKI